MTTTLLDVDQVGELVGCGPDRASELLSSGVLPGVRFGRHWRVPERALEQRLVELALEQAAERRARPAPSTLDVVMAAQRGRVARVPPVLPNTDDRPSVLSI
jgi:excisionase family DNA binding protein